MSPVTLSTATKEMRTSGHSHAGWLPEDASIGERTLEVEIQEDVDAYLLICWDVKNGSFVSDTWHVSLEEAKRQAKEDFGIEEEDWQAPDVIGALSGLV